MIKDMLVDLPRRANLSLYPYFTKSNDVQKIEYKNNTAFDFFHTENIEDSSIYDIKFVIFIDTKSDKFYLLNKSSRKSSTKHPDVYSLEKDANGYAFRPFPITIQLFLDRVEQ